MFKIPLPDLKQKIIESGKISAQDLDEKIKSKINELSGLISEEGAAHIIANELGVTLAAASGGNLKVKEIYAGMKSVYTAGKVVKKYETREFSKNDKSGRVCSVLLGDETGTVRVVFWNEQVDLLDSVKENDIIAVEDAYARENNGGREVHLGQKGSIKVNPDDVEIGEVRLTREYQRKTIEALQGGEQNTELMGTVVQVFDPRFFLVHPETGKRIREGEEGDVTPSLAYVMNAVVDDGTGNIRCVFWKNQTNHLLGKEESDMTQYKEDPASFESMKTDLLGEQFKLMGRVKKNDMFDRLEFNAQVVEKANPKEEIEKIEGN